MSFAPCFPLSAGRMNVSHLCDMVAISSDGNHVMASISPALTLSCWVPGFLPFVLATFAMQSGPSWDMLRLESHTYKHSRSFARVFASGPKTAPAKRTFLGFRSSGFSGFRGGGMTAFRSLCIVCEHVRSNLCVNVDTSWHVVRIYTFLGDISNPHLKSSKPKDYPGMFVMVLGSLVLWISSVH